MPATFSIYFDDRMRKRVSVAAAALGISGAEFVRRACSKELDAQMSQIAAHLDIVTAAS